MSAPTWEAVYLQCHRNLQSQRKLLEALKAVLNHDHGQLPQDVHEMAVEAIRDAEVRS